jgi:hypothetical protein
MKYNEKALKFAERYRVVKYKVKDNSMIYYARTEEGIKRVL